LRYFFQLNCGAGSIADAIGKEFDSIDDAFAHAMTLADKLEKERPGAALERYVVVTDEEGEEVARVYVGRPHRTSKKTSSSDD
jgi:hypothetical protein